MSTVLLTSVVEAPAEPGNVPGITVTRISVSGERHAACIVEAVAGAYPRLDDPAAALRALDGQKVTVLRYGENMLGAGMIFTEEGTLFNGGIALLPKGKRRNGHRLSADSVLDVVPGYDHAALAARVAAVRAQFPEVRELTNERVAALPVDSAHCTLAVFGRWRMPDVVGTDAVWLLSGFLPDETRSSRGCCSCGPTSGCPNTARSTWPTCSPWAARSSAPRWSVTPRRWR